MWAAAEGNVEVVEALIEAGADFRARLDSGFTPLLFAVREGQIGVVRALLKAGADVNETIPAQTSGREPARRRGTPPPGTSALHLAVDERSLSSLRRILLDAGADPNAIGPGYTALHIIPGPQARRRRQRSGAAGLRQHDQSRARQEAGEARGEPQRAHDQAGECRADRV